ncbi:MAG TPA: hypothetical protein VFA12_09855 [Stellaceae bacterium]|nr:hypothetical protein [Stellaceae bacterium]
MRRFLIPFALGLMLGIASMPTWTSPGHPQLGPIYPVLSLVVQPATK